jgi:hypothetical protein
MLVMSRGIGAIGGNFSLKNVTERSVWPGGLDLVGVEEPSRHRTDEAGICPVATTKAKANTNVPCQLRSLTLFI